ncbi:MAG: hypothetical protein KGM24_07200, partial [Elusimicrobia bacterium]|nr:hypothetical protein [Elusimicrobiota bacterium]
MRAAALSAAAFLTAALAAAAPSPAPARSPLEAFTAAFGADGVRTLSERGYVVVQGDGDGARLAAVHWKALQGLAAAAASCRTLSRDFASAAEGVLVPTRAESGYAACRALPEDGAMTGRLHALADEVAAAREESWSLLSSSASLAEPPGRRNVFDTDWGRALAARTRADRLEDPEPLIRGVFDDLLAGPAPNADAVSSFLAEETRRGASDAGVLLASAAVRGFPPPELRALIRRWLLDERRRRGLVLAQARLKAMARDRKVRRELSALDRLCAALDARPDLLSSLEAAVSAAPAREGPPRLRSAGLHLEAPTRLGQYELGDEARVSGAYWVDGLPEGAKVAIEETTFVETPAGFADVETRRVKRRDGGPYPYSRVLTISRPGGFAARAIVSAASGGALDERVEVPVAPDFELALRKEAAALQDEQACDPKSAGAAFAALEGLVADAAKVKPQYKKLLERAEAGRRRAAGEAEELSRLDADVEASRGDSAPQSCRYDASRVDAAIKAVRRLPPGCDKVLPELFGQRALISRRAEDQRWFLKTSREARGDARDCRAGDAVRLWTDSLAVLAADPAARCGAVAAEAARVEKDLPAARASLAWDAELSREWTRAYAASGPAAKLAVLRPLIARLASLPDASCRGEGLSNARRQADLAAAAIPAPRDPSSLLPKDSDLSWTELFFG